MSPFRAPSILLANKWKKENHRRHQEKVTTSRTRLDTKCPPRYIHLSIDLKRMQKEEEQQATVDYQNRVLLQKLSSVMRNPCGIDNWNDYEKKTHRSLNINYRERQEEDRLRANQQFVRRLSNVKPQYDVSALDNDYKKHKYRQQLLSETTKEYEINMGSTRRLRDVQDGRASKNKMAAGSHGNMESESRSALGETAEELAEEADQLGDLPTEQKPAVKRKPKPKAKRLNEADENMLAAYLMKSSVQTMAEYDAKLLYKVVKSQSQPTDIYIRTLVRRKYPQRMKTKKKFKEMFDLDLIDELHTALPAYSAITDVLFSDIEASALGQLHAVIEEGSASDFISALLNYESEQLRNLRGRYKKKFNTTMEAAIAANFPDDSLVTFLTVLLEAMATSGLTTDQLRAKENVAELEVDEDPFASDGTISRVLEAHGPNQLALLNRCCAENGSSLVDLLTEKEASLEATDAVAFLLDTFGSSSHFEGRARFLNSNMAADNRDFLAELTALSESPVQDQVHKEYRKLFRIPLMEDIARRCRGETTGIVMAMAENRRGPLGRGGKGKVKIEIVNAPPRRPIADRTLTVDSNNPLYRPSQRSYADAAQHTLNQLRGRPDNSSNMNSSRKPKPGNQSDAASDLSGLFIAKSGDPGKKSGTIGPNPKFDPETEAKRCAEHLEEAEDAAGKIGAQLAGGNGQQRQNLCRKYKELFTKDLASDLLDVAEGPEWSRLISLLLEPTPDSEVAQLQSDLTSGLSVAYLLSASEADLATLKKKYKEATGETELLEDLAGASEFGQLLADQLGGKKEKSFAVNEEAVRKDADVLDQMDGPIGLRSEELTKLLKKSSVHICQTFELLAKRRHKAAKEVFEEVFDAANASHMQNFIQGLANPLVLFAELLSDALKAMNHDLLLSIVVTRSENDLDKIKTTYKKLYQESLYEKIDQELGSSGWKDTLLQLIKP